ncbi:hypothetical protein Ahia01_000491700, partial [Argonauta hians]
SMSATTQLHSNPQTHYNPLSMTVTTQCHSNPLSMSAVPQSHIEPQDSRDPLSFTHCYLYVSDILNLVCHPFSSGVYNYNGHSISRVAVIGLVNYFQTRELNTVIGVDDGTGMICCCIWKNQKKYETATAAAVNLEKSLPDSLRSKVDECVPDLPIFDLGDLVHVRGRLKSYAGVNEITAYYVKPIRSPAEEVTYLMQKSYLYRKVYDRLPRSPPSGVTLHHDKQALCVQHLLPVIAQYLERETTFTVHSILAAVVAAAATTDDDD